MQKLSVFIVSILFLAGCSWNNFASTPTSHGQAFQLEREKNEEEYWIDTDVLLTELFEKHDLLSEKSQPAQFFEPAKQSWDITNEEAKNNIITKYLIRSDVYELVGTSYISDDDNIPQEFSLVKNGQVIFTAPMCFGAEGPIRNFGYVQDKLTFTFATDGCGATNVYYDGKTFNEQYMVEGSEYPFLYQGKIGFIGRQEGKEYVYFNGQKVSEEVYDIPTYQCCLSIAPLIMLSENGAFLFRAQQGEDYIIVEIDLNKYLIAP